MCIGGGENQQEVLSPAREAFLEGASNETNLEDPSKEAFLEDSVKEVAIHIIEGGAARVVLKKDSSAEYAQQEEQCELTEGARSENGTPETVVKGIQRIVCNADVDFKSFEGSLFTDEQPAAHSGGMEENPKIRGGEKVEEKEEGGEEASDKEETNADLVLIPKLRPRRRQARKGEKFIPAAQTKKTPLCAVRDWGSDFRKVKTRAGGIKREVDGTELEEQLQIETCERRSKRRRKLDQEGNIAADAEENSNPNNSSRGAEASKEVQLVSKGKLGLGDQVTVSWEGDYYKCKVVAVDAVMVKVHYLGWSNGYDEWIPILSRSSIEAQPSKVTIKGEYAASAAKANLRSVELAPKQKRGDLDVEEIAKLLTRSSLNLEPLLPPTKVFWSNFSFLAHSFLFRFHTFLK